MRKAIEAQRLVVEGISIAHGVVKVEIENDRYYRDTEAISRTARALSATAPADIAAFEITTTMSHLPLTTVTFSRTELDAEARGDTTPAELWSATILSDASPDTEYGTGPHTANSHGAYFRPFRKTSSIRIIPPISVSEFRRRRVPRYFPVWSWTMKRHGACGTISAICSV